MHPHTAHKHTNLLWIFLGIIFCALFLVFSLPKNMQAPVPTGAQVIEFTPSVITVSSVSPSSVYQMATVQLNITGADFNSSAVVSIENVTVFTPVVVNDTLIEVNITVPLSSSEGIYDINVTQDNESASLISGLTILEGPFDPSTLTNVTPASGYTFRNTILNLTYNVTVAFGVDSSIINITGGYIEVVNLNTSNETYLNLTNWTNTAGIFTFQFAEHNFSEDGTHFGELYLNVSDGIVEEEREYYSYLAVGSPCFAVSVLGGSCCEPGAPVSGVLGFGGCDGTTTVCGQDYECEPIFLPGLTPATLTCPAGAVTCTFDFLLQSGLFCELGGSGGFCPGDCFFDTTCTIPTYSCPPGSSMGALGVAGTKVCTAPPPSGGGGGGGSNSYTGNVICPTYCKDPKYSHVSVCSQPPCAALTIEQPAQTTQPVVAALSVPKVELKKPPQPIPEQKPVEVYVPPAREFKMPPLPAPVEPVEQQSSSNQSLVFAVIAVWALLAVFVYWRLLRANKRGRK